MNESHVCKCGHVFGAKFNNKHIGSFNSSITVFSLHANKIITSGEGGFVCTNNSA